MNRDQKRIHHLRDAGAGGGTDRGKAEQLPRRPRDAMFRDLIIRGLVAWGKQSGKNSQPV